MDLLSVSELQRAGGDCADMIAHLIEKINTKVFSLLSRLHCVDACRHEEIGHRLFLFITHAELINDNREHGLIVID